jgi:hypothetical protein
MMILTEYKKSNGDKLVLPEGIKLSIEEISNGIYKIEMFDEQGRNVGKYGEEVDLLVSQALRDLLNMKE